MFTRHLPYQSNLEQREEEDVHRFNANTTPFDTRAFRICEVRHLWRVLQPVSHGYKGGLKSVLLQDVSAL